MKAERVYRMAEKNGVRFEAACTDLSLDRWERLMEGSRKGNQKRIEKLLADQGHLKREELKYHNPYNHLITDTHIIYVHSSIEHFYRICS